MDWLFNGRGRRRVKEAPNGCNALAIATRRQTTLKGFSRNACSVLRVLRRHGAGGARRDGAMRVAELKLCSTGAVDAKMADQQFLRGHSISARVIDDTLNDARESTGCHQPVKDSRPQRH